MSITKIDIGEPFFSLELVEDEQRVPVSSKTIVVNLSVNPITIEKQQLAEFQSNYVTGTNLVNVNQAILIRNLRPDLSEKNYVIRWESSGQVPTRSVKRSGFETWVTTCLERNGSASEDLRFTTRQLCL